MNEKNLELIRDIKVNVHVRLGHCNLPMQEIVSLEPGTLIQLEEKSNDLVSLYVNNKLIAYGEVVTIEDQLGIRIKEMVNTPSELKLTNS